ncbi:MAG: hypothetical protein ACE5Q6_16280 [Dehalococcoidia bacterium]
MPRKASSKPQSGPQYGLTPIPQRIHCAATNDPLEPDVNEQDEIDIDNFLDALAEVALAIASRKLANRQSEAAE